MSKTRSISIAFTLIIVAEANLLAAAGRGIEPIILSAGSIFAALSMESLDAEPSEDPHFWKTALGLWAVYDLVPWKKIKDVGEKIVTKDGVKTLWKKTKSGAKSLSDKVDKYLDKDDDDTKDVTPKDE